MSPLPTGVLFCPVNDPGQLTGDLLSIGEWQFQPALNSPVISKELDDRMGR